MHGNIVNQVLTLIEQRLSDGPQREARRDISVELQYAVCCNTMQYYALLCTTLLFSTLLYYTILYYTILYYTGSP